MPRFKCSREQRFNKLWKESDWQGILNALGDRMGNAHGVGNDAKLISIDFHNAVKVDSTISCLAYEYDLQRKNGNSIDSSNDFYSLGDIPFDIIPRKEKIMLGGTLTTHKCSSCHGRGEVRCPICNGSGWCVKCSGKGYVVIGDRRVGCSACYSNSCDGFNQHSGWCSNCKGGGWIPCKECNGKGEYQTYKTLKVTEKEVSYIYCPYEALAKMIKKQKLPTLVFYDECCLKMKTLRKIEYSDLDNLFEKIELFGDTKDKTEFKEVFDYLCEDIKERDNVCINEMTVHAEVATIAEIKYEYRKKTYSLFLSLEHPTIYCYEKFPGRFFQRIREWLGSNKENDKKTPEKNEGVYQK